jgi:hypothetical protein
MRGWVLQMSAIHPRPEAGKPFRDVACVPKAEILVVLDILQEQTPI